ncbi:unnamed protein product, partial [Anisakis simplex]|uniref:Uncharacterized protein n=1 Tax=Anisakis simplex TaxID=6269 RepID=A0A0M3JNB2_ANISI
MAALYSDFFEQLQVVLPSNYFANIKSSKWFNKFFESIADPSDGGRLITTKELLSFKDSQAGEELIAVWNATVQLWESGQIDPLTETNASAISFANARK